MSKNNKTTIIVISILLLILLVTFIFNLFIKNDTKLIENFSEIDTDTLNINNIALILSHEGTVYIHKDNFNFYVYKNYIIMAFSIILVLAVAIAVLSCTISKKNKTEKELKRALEKDFLTGAYNRRCFKNEMVNVNQEKNLPISIIIVGLNGLKLANDVFGHDMGDEMLIECASSLERIVGDAGSVFRIGGDEFSILLPKVDKNKVISLEHSINSILSNNKVGNIKLSISTGYETKNNSEENIYDIFKIAEDYMYKDKLYERHNQNNNIISAIMNTLHEKSKREKEHSERVAQLCMKFGKELGCSKNAVDEFYLIGLLHDVGKVVIDKSILNKAGRLNDIEWENMKSHSEAGFRILSSINKLSGIAKYILYHHERWDGTGYPERIAKDKIPIESRILTIADSYDAMVSGRPYKKAFSKEQAIKEIINKKGKQFDPDLADFFVNNVIK